MKKVFSIILLLLSGCAVGPDYERPAAVVSDVYKETPQNWKEAQPRDEIARGAWWEIFGDPQLNALVVKIDVSNQSLAASEAQFRQATAAIGVARAPLFPSVDANVSITKSRSPTGAIVLWARHLPSMVVVPFARATRHDHSPSGPVRQHRG